MRVALKLKFLKYPPKIVTRFGKLLVTLLLQFHKVTINIGDDVLRQQLSGSADDNVRKYVDVGPNQASGCLTN